MKCVILGSSDILVDIRSGKDGLVRVVTVEIKNSIFKKTMTKISIVPFKTSSPKGESSVPSTSTTSTYVPA